jgi:hypothetical protein
VLEQVRHGRGVAEVVRSHHLEVAAALQVRAKEVPSDPPESVDPNPNSHGSPPDSMSAFESIGRRARGSSGFSLMR